MRGEVGKEIPKKMVNRRIFMTSNMTIFAVPLEYIMF